MAGIIRRAILKGHLFGVVSTRNMFTGEMGDADGGSPMDTAQGYVNRLLTPIMPYLGSAFTTETLELQVQDGATWFTVDESPDVWVGTAGGQTIANAVAGVLVGVVSMTHSHGRKFFSGLAESAVSGNVLDTAALAAFVSSAAYYIALYTHTDGSFFRPGIIVKGSGFQSFTSGFVSSLLGSMDRRKPGIGI